MKNAIISVVVGVVLFGIPMLAGAQSSTGGGGGGGSTGGGGTTIFSTGGGGGGGSTGGGGQPTNCGSGPCTLQNPLAVTSFCGLLKKVIDAVVAIAIPVAVVFIIWSGFKFVLAQGKPGGIKKAKSNFFYTMLGLAIFLGAWLIVKVMAATLAELGVTGISSCI